MNCRVQFISNGTMSGTAGRQQPAYDVVAPQEHRHGRQEAPGLVQPVQRRQAPAGPFNPQGCAEAFATNSSRLMKSETRGATRCEDFEKAKATPRRAAPDLTDEGRQPEGVHGAGDEGHEHCTRPASLPPCGAQGRRARRPHRAVGPTSTGSGVNADYRRHQWLRRTPMMPIIASRCTCATVRPQPYHMHDLLSAW